MNNWFNNIRIYHLLIDRFNGVWQVPPKSENAFCGGNLQGVIEEVDPHFGTWDDYQQLLDKAHEKGLKIICDLPKFNLTNSEVASFADSTKCSVTRITSATRTIRALAIQTSRGMG